MRGYIQKYQELVVQSMINEMEETFNFNIEIQKGRLLPKMSKFNDQLENVRKIAHKYENIAYNLN